MTYPAGPPTGAPAVCVRHPDRPTGLACTRCARPACPECLREASVGYQCVDCVRQGQREVRRATTVAGAVLGARPLVVPALVVLNLLAFAATAVQAGSIGANTRSALFVDWALSPGTVAAGEWWRLVTSGFLHIGPLHLAFNMFALWIIGRDMEMLVGRGRFLAVYLLGMLGGAAAVMVLYGPGEYVAGASGAVFGLMGGLVVALLRLRRPLNQVLGLLAVNLALGFFVPGISWQAHLGGLLAGAAATAVLVYAPPARRAPVQGGGLAAIAVVLLVVVAAGAVLAGA
ncbi:rhomboid family intramembrane serine protease [Pseudonocardia hydrocarbonoxydans]|uniref:rhomboid family intramembrane serine protease n=1 Tax=Pseudonocardia hydrocarbonoxydans TaxID=76726 RepID=UPI001141375C|nr:rhomboid family intramembrane serine protease [Pseudonocardia hydrocarbonoxydans]